MSGWNIIYGLINFLILAVGLYFVGRKLVIKGVRDHRDKVVGDLERSAAARENARQLLDGIEPEKASAAAECEQILRQARESAAEISRASGEGDREAASRIAVEAHKDLRRLVHAQRIRINEKAAEEITAAAAEQIARPENAAARAALTDRFIERLPGHLRITPGDLSSLRAKGSVASEAPRKRSMGSRNSPINSE